MHVDVRQVQSTDPACRDDNRPTKTNPQSSTLSCGRGNWVAALVAIVFAQCKGDLPGDWFDLPQISRGG
jgi:hypothetical protein